MSFQNSIVLLCCPLNGQTKRDLPQVSGVKWVDG
ncbi:hypothetical protein L3Y21_gp045 [Gordonia phage Rabbitrun]|uniref:Uncharacterized protein n=1 Tax=Gordonia phage Rabbitrun TaxID=2762280 RepID=A0A7G8LIU7_9CAUD|nr:hypothetical protein L3Y21_gp045 [Gordonia phage Rabbitrun]QNJ57169.1 hypothetical protein SEA_RABBITRUN_45 [Gordonia phage Rabbitrun]